MLMIITLTRVQAQTFHKGCFDREIKIRRTNKYDGRTKSYCSISYDTIWLEWLHHEKVLIIQVISFEAASGPLRCLVWTWSSDYPTEGCVLEISILNFQDILRIWFRYISVSRYWICALEPKTLVFPKSFASDTRGLVTPESNKEE